MAVRAFQDVLDGEDPRLDLALLILGRVVTAVLAQVPDERKILATAGEPTPAAHSSHKRMNLG